MIVSVAISLLIPMVVGFVFLSLLWPAGLPSKRDLLIQIPLSLGLGLGITSCAYFVWLLVIGPMPRTFLGSEAVLLILLAFYLIFFRRRNADLPVPQRPVPDRPYRNLSWVLRVAFSLGLVCMPALFLAVSLYIPHGMDDAISSWDLRARVLFRGADEWTRVFSPYYSGADYPLLLPGSIALSWAYVGKETVAVPASIAFAFTFGTIWLACAGLSRVRGSNQGMLAGLILLGTPFFILHGAAKYADIPVGFFYLATIVLFCLHDHLRPNHNGWLILAGMAAGLSAWTKNEGILFCLSVLAGRLVAHRATNGWKVCFKELRFVLLGAVPVLLVVAYFKLFLAAPNDLLASKDLRETTEKLLDGSRYILIAKTFARISNQFAASGKIDPLPALTAYLICSGVSIDKRSKATVLTSTTALFLMIVGYFCIYLKSPFELVWHMESSLNRLFVQLWPSAVFSYFLVASPLEKVLRRKEPG